MSDLPVREMVLYKHGVGFFRREGRVNTEAVTLTFRHDEINDVLKSLAVFDREGGQVLGIHYQTPLDRAARLADSSIRLSDDASLCDLLRDLRGRTVELIFSEEVVRGQMIGIDRADEDVLSDSLLSVIRETDGEIGIFRLKTLRGIRLLDAQAQHDLLFFLDTSKSEELRRHVTLRLSPGKHRLTVYYVAPCPTWRVSYRLAAEASEDGQSGTALLQGWGLFDNRLDEDLKDVKVTLVAGQPISFIYDLYASHIPQRPVVEDEARIAPGPVEFRAPMKSAPLAAARPLGRMLEEEEEAMAYAPPSPVPLDTEHALTREALEGAIQRAAEGREAGEFFAYEVTTPVTVKRGESALVPIIGAEVRYTRELLYNGAKLPRYPVAALRFTNTSGLTLERGPVTVIEDGEYKGEAIVPFTRSGGDVYLPYAVELGVRVTERHEQHTEMAGLSLHEGYLLINEYHVHSTTYVLENDTAKDQVVTIEAPIRSDFELVNTPPPDAETAAERRWRVRVPARESVLFERHERRLTWRREEVRKLDYRRLQRFFEERWLDQAAYERLTVLLNNLALIQNAHAEQKALKDEREEIYARQAQLRENLTALKPAGEEGVLRARVLSQLSATEDRLENIERRLAEIAAQIEQAEKQVEEALNMLGEQTGAS